MLSDSSSPPPISAIDDTLYTISSFSYKWKSIDEDTLPYANGFNRKYEEISPPHTDDFCYITDNTYTKQDIVKMEADVLKTLKFEMGSPTVKTFLRRFTRIAQENYNVSAFLSYLQFLDFRVILQFLTYAFFFSFYRFPICN